MKPLDYVLSDKVEVLKFLKERYPLYHLSNVFFRDIQYGILQLLERKKMKVGYAEAEEITTAFVQALVKEKIFSPIDRQSWLLHYEPFRKVSTKPAAKSAPAAKAAPSAPAAGRPAGGLPPLKSGTPAGARPAGGLPPLKSATPAGVAAAPPASSAAQAAQSSPKTEDAPVQPVAVAEKPKPPVPASGGGQGGTVPPLGKKTLPPITSSKPVGG